MRAVFCVAAMAFAASAWAGAPAADKGAKPGEELVLVQDVIPDAIEELRYATEDNFMKRAVYPKDARCFLRKSVVEKLAKAAVALKEKGYRLRLYDCYRPLSVQWELWKIMPKPGYVADPRKGSNHNRGAAVDLTLATLDGGEVEMPTPYDSFLPAAHHGYAGGTETSRQNRETLREAMEAAGFKKNRMEWWHYDAKDNLKFKVMDEPFAK